MHSIRRAATRASVTRSASAAFGAVAPKSQTISSALRAAVSVRCFSVAAPKQFSITFRLAENSGFRGRRHADPPNGLFLQNYSFEVTAEDIKEAFSKYGEVDSVSMPEGKSFCFVYFKEAESVKTAAENVDGTFWHGRRLVASPRGADNPRPAGGRPDYARKMTSNRKHYDGPPTDTLWVGNLPFDSSDVDMNNLFSKVQGVKDVRVAIDRMTGLPRGFAHAEFESVDAAIEAQKVLHAAEFADRRLKADFAPAFKDGPAARLGPALAKGTRSLTRGEYKGPERIEERVEAEHAQAEQGQVQNQPEAGKQENNWNA